MDHDSFENDLLIIADLALIADLQAVQEYLPPPRPPRNPVW